MVPVPSTGSGGTSALCDRSPASEDASEAMPEVSRRG